MHAKFAHHREEGRHLCRVIGRNRHAFAADKDIEGARVQNDLAVIAVDFFPIGAGAVVADQVQIDHPGMRLRPVSHQRCARQAQIHRKAEPIVDERVAIHQRRLFVQHAQRRIVEPRLALGETDLVQPHAGTDEH